MASGAAVPSSACLRTAGQKRGVTEQIKRALRRRSAIEPVIGHLKEGHRMGRNHLADRGDDAVNALMAVVGYNFRLLVAWLATLLRALLALAPGTPEVGLDAGCAA